MVDSNQTIGGDFSLSASDRSYTCRKVSGVDQQAINVNRYDGSFYVSQSKWMPAFRGVCQRGQQQF